MTAGASAYGPTGSAEIDGLLTGVSWNTTELTFSFPASRSDFEPDYYDNAAISNHLSQLTAGQQDAVVQVLTQIETFTKLTFTDVTDTATNPDLRYALSRDPATAYSYYPNANPVGGDSFYNDHRENFDNVKPGSYGFMTFMHETGHALGLKHGHEAEGLFPSLPRSVDSHEFTVMTYREFVKAPADGVLSNEKFGFPQSFMMLDIAALQTLYGANYDYNSGDTVYAFSPSTGQMTINGVDQALPGANRIFTTIWDGGGEDTYDLSNYGSNLVIRLDPGSWSRTKKGQLAALGNDHLAHGNIYNALLHDGDERSLIENAKGGSGNDRIVGNSADNTLIGNRGHDKLSGRDGDDVLIGGDGRDKLSGGSGNDVLTGDGGRDKLSGGSGNDVLTGDGGRDKLSGGSGDDVLTGSLGRDFLSGGGGADVFVFNSLADSNARAKKADIIKDFSVADGDQIDLSNLAADAGVAIQLIGRDSFSKAPGELRLGKHVVALDMDGDGNKDFAIKLADLRVDKLHIDDFIV